MKEGDVAPIRGAGKARARLPRRCRDEAVRLYFYRRLIRLAAKEACAFRSAAVRQIGCRDRVSPDESTDRSSP